MRVGIADILIVEHCHSDVSMALGNDLKSGGPPTTGSHIMQLDDEELATFRASDITFKSDHGHIEIHHLIQSANMSGITNSVTFLALNESKRILFTSGVHQFHVS